MTIFSLVAKTNVYTAHLFTDSFPFSRLTCMCTQNERPRGRPGACPRVRPHFALAPRRARFKPLVFPTRRESVRAAGGATADNKQPRADYTTLSDFSRESHSRELPRVPSSRFIRESFATYLPRSGIVTIKFRVVRAGTEAKNS